MKEKRERERRKERVSERENWMRERRNMLTKEVCHNI